MRVRFECGGLGACMAAVAKVKTIKRPQMEGFRRYGPVPEIFDNTSRKEQPVRTDGFLDRTD